jgi:hypothetical protein
MKSSYVWRFTTALSPDIPACVFVETPLSCCYGKSQGSVICSVRLGIDVPDYETR